MRVFRHVYSQLTLYGTRLRFKPWPLRRKLLATLIPSVVLILIATGYITIWVSNNFLTEALGRNVRLQTLVLAHELENCMAESKEDLLTVGQSPIARAGMVNLLKSSKKLGKVRYRELAYISLMGQDHIFLIDEGNHISVIPAAEISLIQPSPYLLRDNISQLKRGDVWISDIIKAVYPVSVGKHANQKFSAQIIRFITPYFGGDNSLNGYLLLALDVHQLRDILSLFNSSRSPIHAYPRSPERRYYCFFDKEGWVLFQSEPIEGRSKKLSADMAKYDFSGLSGRPGLESAFRPDSTHKRYWQMVKDIRNGKHGLFDITKKVKHYELGTSRHFLGYAPVRFTAGRDQKPIIFGGVAFVDNSRLTVWAGYRHMDVMFVIIVSSMIIICLFIFGLSRIITKPILDLATAVNQIKETGKLQEIDLPYYDDETSGLKNAVNKMVVRLRDQIEQIHIKDEMLEKERQREKVRLEEEVEALKKRLQSHTIEEILGVGPAIDSLKSNIIKAASVDADVLIIGETGTGKQLTAEAIVKHGSRAEKPFVSINCGALDENLLLDALFGHVKGAFTEAKADRRGAFLAANGGTLFLDEISAASAKVQGALLRAISHRKIKQLGSDREVDVNVRLITATNLDLKALIEKGLFREDLYYRLEVLTIYTPALRYHKEDIPVLVNYFLKQAGRLMKKEDVSITKGALEKMRNHHWPGNIRELINCVTRSVAMTEGEIIYAEDINLGAEKPARLPTEGAMRYQAARPEPPSQEIEAIFPGLNARQKKAFPSILRKREITRLEYQDIIGNNLPSRTALYDLNDLVKRGLLKKIGRGPATRYYHAKLP